MVNRAFKHGFTLVELSIVMIIIGLILGAVTAGSRLIKNARLQAQIVQISDINVAVGVFVERYYGLPGDLPNGVSLGLQDAGHDGDGDGTIDLQTEREQFFVALSNAELVKESYADGEFPEAAIGKRGFVIPYYFTDIAENKLVIATVAAGTTTTSSLTGAEAYKIDIKIDDGLAYQGDSIVYYNGDWDNLGYAASYFAGTEGADTDCATAGVYDATSTTNVTKNGDVEQCPLLVTISY